jgi:nucleotide-binding universal stress UspA family protein
MAGELVVVGVDGSPQSIAALRWAVRYGEASGATVRAVRAWHYPAAVGPGPEGRAPREVTQQVEQQQLEDLEIAVSEAFPDRRPDIVETRVAFGHAAEALIEQSGDADLLVVGNKGRSAFSGMLLGSVSLHCVTGAACPVVVVRMPATPQQEGWMS